MVIRHSQCYALQLTLPCKSFSSWSVWYSVNPSRMRPFYFPPPGETLLCPVLAAETLMDTQWSSGYSETPTSSTQTGQQTWVLAVVAPTSGEPQTLPPQLHAYFVISLVSLNREEATTKKKSDCE
ncbi:Hypothetical predicted protein [Podarcis lilfordi]|uniref:Uncharacterized protein n=1 Tax=Podarcis lilfordi TaxID=74358 RepID=A0AA35NYB0_9SAUR|nr:Hypothetical predicted protein [Podarcis lilfordi]